MTNNKHLSTLVCTNRKYHEISKPILLYFDEFSLISINDMLRLEEKLPLERYIKANLFKRHLDRKQSVLSFLLLKYALKYYYQYNDEIEFCYSESGKPYLARNNIFFNLSHCDIGVVCALDFHEIGVDIQDWIKFDDSLAKWICSECEYEFLLNTEEKDFLLTKIWTSKESALKCSGRGITKNLKNYCLVSNRENITLEDYCYNHYISNKYIITSCSYKIKPSLIKITKSDLLSI